MSTATLETSPVWLEEQRPQFAPVTRDATYDAVIVGGGITGLTAAYLLKKAGRKVAVLEKGRISDAETGHTTAHLTQVMDERLKDLVSRFGKDRARLAWEGGAAAINTIEAIVGLEQIACEFQRVPGFLCSPITEDASTENVKDLEAEAELARELGFDALFVSAAPLFNRPAVRFANQAAFHVVEYLSHLARLIQGEGCDVFEESEMSEVHADPLCVEVNGFKLTCGKLIIATHVPLMGKTGLVSATLMQTKLAAFSSYVVGATVPKGVVPEALYWDTQSAYYYLRTEPREHDDFLIFGGQDHRTGQADDTEERFQRLEEVLLQYVPEAKVDHRWSGQVIETPDGLPYIGESADNQFIATGFAGNGMTFGTLSGMMACDYVLGRNNPWADLFSTDRRALRGGLWNYLKENFSYPHYLISGFVKTPDADSVDEVGRGEGKILKLDGHRCAVHRDATGNLKVVSAICTHMGCVVRWNQSAATWDCPCHGSRFNTDGEVMAGPAETPLEKRSVADGV